MAVTVSVIYNPTNDRHDIGEFGLSFTDQLDRVHETKLKFNMDSLWEFCQDVESVAFDFLVTSMVVYNVDRAINRLQYSDVGWSRNLNVVGIPVRNLQAMNNSKLHLESAINFLTGDCWSLEFIQADVYNYAPDMVRNYNRNEYEKVALFSGGLDSLIGFVDETYTLSPDKKILLISHMELGKEHNDQSKILGYCAEHGIYDGKYDQLLLNAGLKIGSWNIPTKSESTFRSRSLLFFAAGLYAAFNIGEHVNLIVPENGTISINIPLDPGRRSSCSTRTTHPTFIKKLELALSDMGVNNRLYNPYRLKSKADMMLDCFRTDAKKVILEQLYDFSCSCAKRGHNFYWDKSSNEIKVGKITHCGMCLPCIYRRVALDAVGLDDTGRVGTDVFNGVRFDLNNNMQKSSRDFRALLSFLKSRNNPAYIKQELMLNGIYDRQELNEYIDLAIHSYDQVKDWINRKGNVFIKRKAGII